MRLVIGTAKMLSNTGCPWPGGESVSFEQADIAALGKLYCWGSSCIQFIVRLTDGREFFVRADKQAKEDERFLRKLARKVPLGRLVSRDVGWRMDWLDVPEPEPARGSVQCRACAGDGFLALDSDTPHNERRTRDSRVCTYCDGTGVSREREIGPVQPRRG